MSTSKTWVFLFSKYLPLNRKAWSLFTFWEVSHFCGCFCYQRDSQSVVVFSFLLFCLQSEEGEEAKWDDLLIIFFCITCQQTSRSVFCWYVWNTFNFKGFLSTVTRKVKIKTWDIPVPDEQWIILLEEREKASLIY